MIDGEWLVDDFNPVSGRRAAPSEGGGRDE